MQDASIEKIEDIELFEFSSESQTDIAQAISSLTQQSQNVNAELLFFASSPKDSYASLGWKTEEAKELAHALEQKSSELGIRSKQEQAACSLINLRSPAMKGKAGLVGHLFTALGRNGVNLLAFSQGQNEESISLVIEKKNLEKATTILEEEFAEQKKRTLNLVLIGPGNIGAACLRQLADSIERSNRRVAVRLVGLANSSHVLFNRDGIEMNEATQQLASCQNPFQAEALKKQILKLNLGNVLLVDCTASEYIAELYPSLLRERISIVTPNKLAHAASLKRYQELKRLSAETDVKFYYEASVGAGLPVIGTLHDLLASGDQVIEIEGILSGTLSYIFNSLSEDKSYSEIIKSAHAQGLTEPDPREDLSGMDVARKLLILGRESGLPLELSDITLNSLLPEGAENADSAEKLFELLKGLDEEIAEAVKTATLKQERLCYMAKLKIDKNSETPKFQATIGLQSIPHTHPFFGLSGTDNIISFRTLRYEQYPLVVKGPGAGIEVTAAGVVADILRVSSYLG